MGHPALSGGAEAHRAAGPTDVQDAPDVDDTQLDGLARLLPAARFEAMITVYLNAAKERLECIETLGQRQDLAGLAGEAHDLKGTSGNFGARRLQRLGEHLETACKAGDAATVASLIPAIRDASERAWAIIGRRAATVPLAEMRQAS